MVTHTDLRSPRFRLDCLPEQSGNVRREPDALAKRMDKCSSRLLNSLPTTGKANLRALWQELFGRVSPKALRREIMVPILAYRLQELGLGALPLRARQHLRKISDGIRSNPVGKAAPRLCMKVGTRLIRQWQGKTHHVTVTDDGYEYEGKTFSSLSKVARHITGTQWSGPLFFGLRGSARGGKANG